jgi:hypothetical protein
VLQKALVSPVTPQQMPASGPHVSGPHATLSTGPTSVPASVVGGLSVNPDSLPASTSPPVLLSNAWQLSAARNGKSAASAPTTRLERQAHLERLDGFT